MSEKRYEIPLSSYNPHQVAYTGCALFTLEAIKKLKADCEQALAQAEAEKPKAWDFGIAKGQTSVRIRSGDGWSMASKPTTVHSAIDDDDMHVYGNLKEIVEQQGPIVVGMSVAHAQIIVSAWLGHSSRAFNDPAEHIRDALARYEENRP